MNRFFGIIAIVLMFPVVMFLTGCTGNQGDKEIVSVSIPPLKYFVDRLTDNALDVNIMVPQGASHGTYSPTAQQMRKLSDSRAYFRIGYLGYEQNFINKLKELNPTMREVNLSDYTTLIRGEAIIHGDHVHEGGIDPHIWMSPKVMLTLIPVIRDNLTELYPELEQVITENYPALLSEMESLHTKMDSLTQFLSHKRFLIFHPAMTYLARDYGLEQVSIEHQGKEPTPARLARLIRDAKAEDIPVVFIQMEYDVRNAQLVATETGAAIATINHMQYDWFASIQEIMGHFNNYLK